MTILGRHTVQETLEYIKSQDYRFDRYNEAYKQISAQWRYDNPDAAMRLDKDWAAIYKKWKDLAYKTTLSLRAQMTLAPLVSPNNLPAESEWQEVVAIFDNGKEPGGQRDCEYRIVNAIGHEVDIDSGRPLQNAPDTDIKVIKELDNDIKAMEGAAQQASTSAGKIVTTAAKNNIGLVIGGVVVLGIGAVVAAKVYL